MKILGIAGGIFLGLILFVIGFSMIGPGGPNTYAAPAQFSGFTTFVLPVAYFLNARRAFPPAAGWTICAVMAAIAALLWIPLFKSEWLWNGHAGAMAVWTAIWAIAALPFLRAGVKGLRRPSA